MNLLEKSKLSITSSFPWLGLWQLGHLIYRRRHLACFAWGLEVSFHPWSTCRTCFRIFRKYVYLGDQPCRYLIIWIINIV